VWWCSPPPPSLPWYLISGGSNLLAPDEGFNGVVIHITSSSITFEEEGNSIRVIADAGVVWDEFVSETVARGLWGIENLAGIPGSVGAAPVQNIGAYGVEVKDVLSWVEVLDTKSLELKKLQADECKFGYRESIFKHDSTRIILRVAFTLMKEGAVRAEYKDIAKKVAEGVPLQTPAQVAEVVRAIRAQKFPDLSQCGTAGSFFKNPIISREQFEVLESKYPDVPHFVAGNNVKIPLAWILDNVLNIKGFSEGAVRLFEKQPLVLVTEEGATAQDVDAFANKIATLVLDATGITIEREVRSLAPSDY
jgi:UDP-N-acetylmuramate dehydrogenase